MKKQLISFILFLGLFSGAALAANQNPKNTGQNATMLFIQSAPSAVLIPNSPQTGTYELVLHDVHNTVSYFSERPNRISGTIPIARFVNFWKLQGPDGFNTQAPNADIMGTQIHSIFSAKNANFTFALSQPAYNAKNKSIAYAATPLQGQQDLPKAPIKLEHVKLFFDNLAFCPSCNGPP